jgi:hypothetical protein
VKIRELYGIRGIESLRYNPDTDEVLEFRTKCVGMSFEGRDDLVREYANEYDIVFLRPEPDNPADPNAIKVELGGGIHIGYVPKEVAAVLVSDLRDTEYDCFIDEIDNEIDYRIPELWFRAVRRV